MDKESEKMILGVERRIINVLKIIHKSLVNKKIKWVVSGSTSLFLQGITLKKVSDIDIMSDKKGALKISKILKKYEIKPVKFGKTKIIKSYWGQLKIKNVKVDVMGEFSEKIGKKWVNISKQRLNSHNFIKLGKIKIPVTKLKHHLLSYKILKRKKDIEKIRKIEEFLT
jgi:hypothetical protein